MNKTKFLIMLMFLSALVYLAYGLKNKYNENSLVDCINGILTNLKIDNIQIDVANQINSPVLSGKINTKQKITFLTSIADECKVGTFVDLIEEVNDYDIKTSTINFKLDGFNQIGTITGMVNSAFEHKEILSNFTTAINQYYGPWTIEHEILISKQVSKSNYAVDIALIFSAISLVKLTDITFINNQIIIKGLVRNKIKEDQTLSQLNQIFQGDLEIINQLEQVIKGENDFEGLEIELNPIELIDIKPPKTVKD